MTPTKGNGLTTPHSQPAETHKQASNTHDFTADGESAPVGDVSLLRRLQRQFEQAGMRLYPLDGASLLVVHPLMSSSAIATWVLTWTISGFKPAHRG